MHNIKGQRLALCGMRTNTSRVPFQRFILKLSTLVLAEMDLPEFNYFTLVSSSFRHWTNLCQLLWGGFFIAKLKALACLLCNHRQSYMDLKGVKYLALLFERVSLEVIKRSPAVAIQGWLVNNVSFLWSLWLIRVFHFVPNGFLRIYQGINRYHWGLDSLFLQGYHILKLLNEGVSYIGSLVSSSFDAFTFLHLTFFGVKIFAAL